MNVKINWVIYINNDLFYENKPLQNKTYYKIIPDKHIKSTVRGNLPMNYWHKIGNPHSSDRKIITCSCSGKIIDYESPFNIPPDTSYAILKHYRYKSFEEYCFKIKRGRADINNEELEKLINEFYIKNKENKDKLKIMKKIFNINFKLL